MGSGSNAPPTFTENGTANGRRRLGSRNRSAISATWAIVNASSEPNAKMPSISSTSPSATSATTITDAIDTAT